MMKQSPGPETITTVEGKKYRLLPYARLPEGYEGPSAFLGQGAFGTVSIAIALPDLEVLAVKLLSLNKSDPKYEEIMADVTKEVQVMKHLRRQADIVQIPDENDPNKVNVFILQPLLKGKQLEKYFNELIERSKSLDPKDVVGQLELLNEAVSSFIAAFRATVELHEAGVIHGDLHTGNILYDPHTQRAVDLDFGMSHILKEGEDKVYLSEEATISNIHRAPETVELEVRREGKGPERVYDRSSDVFSLAIDCGISSEFMDHYAPDFAGREIAQLLKLFRDLSQEKMFLKGDGIPEHRLSLKEGIDRLLAIQDKISIRIAQKLVCEMPVKEIRELATQISHLNSFKEQARQAGLPVNIQNEIRRGAQEFKIRQRENELKRSEEKKKPEPTRRSKL